MFGSRYFAGRYFGTRYYGKGAPPVPGFYTGSRYFGNRYFGKRYFGSTQTSDPFELGVTSGLSASAHPTLSGGISFSVAWPFAQTNTLALSSVGSVNAALSFESEDFPFTPPLQLAAAGSMTFTTSLTYFEPESGGVGSFFGGSYFGPWFYGRRYWGSKQDWELEIGQVLSISAVGTFSASLDTTLAFPHSTLAATATAELAAELVFAQPAVDTGGGYWPAYPNVKRKKRKEDEDEAEEVVPEVAVQAPARPVLTLKPIKPAPAPVVAKESVADQIERIAKERAERAKKKKRELEEKLLMGD